MHATPTPKSIGQGTWVVVRLIVCGCGGLYVMLFNSVAFIARVFGVRAKRHENDIAV
jgi:hypothetical protein